MMELTKILVPLAFFATIFGMFYLIMSSRHRERMYMMEHHLNPKDFATSNFFRSFQTLKIGMLMIGISLGILVGHWLSQLLSQDGEIAYPAMVLLFGGISLVIHHFIQRRSIENN